uniref:Uncharacterized protein n=1 Tax=Alexandrium monilatum TaxID=311494 RepID=A0A7S4PXG0_9DINO|mmetsp:Transcript_69412/g.206782  ORF Transcript_69412/g.206782 Transcript_69412/m.206782 type:complete len:621 (+) Transcript_69412:50-1912(+)
MRVSLGSACIVLNIAIATAGVVAHVYQNGFLLGSMELEWVGEKRAPFLMAASIFGSQSLVSLVLIYVLNNMRELADCWGASFQSTLNLYAWMSLVGAVMYFSKYWATHHIVVDLPGLGEYLVMRNLHWIVSTPTQWFIFSQVCTKATPEEMAPIYLSTLLTQVFGMFMCFVGEARMRWYCFWVSTYYFVHSFYLSFKLRLHKDMAVVGARLRVAMLVVWSGFPLVVALRWFGYISPWTEQVFMMSVLDVVTKSITFSAIIVSRVVLSLARINGTVQLVLSSHDVTLAINDAWQLLDNETSSGLVATYFGQQAENTSLIELCINQEHQDRLIQAARKADSQSLGAPTPKVVVAFRMPGGGGEMLAECLVSKCLHGRRIIGIAVASQAGNVFNFGGQDHETHEDWAEQASEISLSSSQSRNPDVQMRLALHNCHDVLQLADEMRRRVNAIFMQSHTACAIFAWEEEGLVPAIVVASPRLQALLLQGKQMPQPLTCLFDTGMVDRLLLAIGAEDIIMHQWRNVRSPSGILMEVTMLPLKGMSCMGSVACACNVELCILVLAVADSQAVDFYRRDKNHKNPGYLRWRPAGCELVCEAGTDAKVRPEFPPRILMPLAMAFLESMR